MDEKTARWEQSKKLISIVIVASLLVLILVTITYSQSKEVKALKNQIYELEHGKENAIVKMRDLLENGENEAAIILAGEIHERYNGTPEDLEAQERISAIREEKEAERVAKEEQANRTTEDAVRGIIRIKTAYTGQPNSAGGVDLHINWVNNSEEAIKYVTFLTKPYNAVGDYVTCTIRQERIFSGQCTGPYEKGSGEGKSRYWKNAWYNNTIVGCSIIGIKIEYMDGSVVELNEQEIPYAIY